MLTADQRKELEALEADLRHFTDVQPPSYLAQMWADRIAAVLANGVEE